MIDLLLPSSVVAVEAFDDLPGEDPFPGEEDLIAKAVGKRRREFVTTRRCARTALRAFGYPDAPIRVGSRREPLWPTGMVGSLTHCAGYRAAAVARVVDVPLLGIDGEPNAPMPEGVIESIALPDEQEMLRRSAASHPHIHWGRVLLSAKESVYKAWFPVTRRWLGLEDARVAIDVDAGTFAATLLVDGARLDGGAPLQGLTGRFCLRGGLIVTAVAAGP